jgi:anaerobic selenocysteine-containing dehydrogenase
LSLLIRAKRKNDMSEKLTRRDFLKLATAGAATTAVLTGCGPELQTRTREPYKEMPEYTYNGLSTYYATTCRECAAGCGLVVRTMQGRAIKVEGNAGNPVNLGKTCARGQATLQGLYNPDRVTKAVKQGRGATLSNDGLDWNDAVKLVADALSKNAPSEIAFLTGLAPDHLFDLVSDLTDAIGAPAPVRYGALSMFEARTTLSTATEAVFGQAAMPFFDLANSDLVLSFGANFLETWLSPVAYTRGFSKMRRGNPRKRGYFIQFEARMSQTGGRADEWIPLVPGTEGLVAQAIGALVAEAKGGSKPRAFTGVDFNQVVQRSGVSFETLDRVAGLVVESQSPVAVPGGAALGQSNGLATAEVVLAFNALVNNLGKAGGVTFSPLAPNQDVYHRPANAREMGDFIAKLKSGAVKVLFVHGVNPLFELPKALGFAEALQAVPQVISFATFPDETALASDVILPDHHGLESWGYQRVTAGVAQSVLSGSQPAIVPFHDTRSTADVLLAAAQQMGGTVAQTLPFKDEFEFLQAKIGSLVGQIDGSFGAPEINSFTAYFQQHGGWWKTAAEFATPSAAAALSRSMELEPAEFAGEGEFIFIPFVSPTLAEAGANKPWLQELADPTTTVMWSSWVELNPETAHELDVHTEDLVIIHSEAGELTVPVYVYPAIHPGVIAMPFGQGHTAYGQFAAGRGMNPADLLGLHFNEAGDLAFAGMKVKVEKTGKSVALPRLESSIGVYGEGMGEEH